jgi:hypothetical protein
MIIYQDRLGTNVQKTQKGRLSSVFRPHGNISASWACAANTASATGVSYNVSVPVGVSAKNILFGTIFWYKPNVLPRQARDKHGKSGQKGKPVSVGEGRYCPAAECEGGENDREGGRDGDLEWRLR